MQIIAHPSGRFQSLAHKKIEVFTAGVYFPKQGKHFVPNCITSPNRTERGAITKFTYHARSRLRRTLLESSCPNSQRLGFTLTLPWRDIEWDEKSLDEFRRCFNLFGTKFRKHFPSSAAIFRVELQKRKAPHIHAIWFLSNDDINLRDLGPDKLTDVRLSAAQRRALLCCLANNEISHLWCSSVPVGPRDNLEGFLTHGTRVDDIVSDGAMFRYLADHTSKSKQEQLGYKGKQWGVLGKSNLVKVEPDAFDFSTMPCGFKSRAVLLRNLQKICRYRVDAPSAPFGFKYQTCKRIAGTFYAAENSVKRLFELPSIKCGLRDSHFEQRRLLC